MSRGVEHSTVTVHAPGGAMHVPVVVAWVRCACGEALAEVARDRDAATDALAAQEYADRWQGDSCPDCARRDR